MREILCKRSVIILLLLFLFFSLLSYLSFNAISINKIITDNLIALAYLSFCALFWAYRYTKILAIIILNLWYINCTISLSTQFIYHFSPSLRLVETTLATNTNEIKLFITNNVFLFFSLIVIYGLAISLITKLARIIQQKSHYYLEVIIITIMLIFICDSYTTIRTIFKQYRDPSYSVLEKAFSAFHFNNFALLARARHNIKLINDMSQFNTPYSFIHKETGIDTYVIVIGESARRKNMSLYGYSLPTTPNLERERENLLVFTQAIAPAPITIMAVPATLSRNSNNKTEVALLKDNIIELANQAGFTTFWYSMQGKIGHNETAITLIANHAHHKEWLGPLFDSAIISKLEQALADKSNHKKLIILHINGSHVDSCDRYPKEEEIFVAENGDRTKACYDNSIHYTDKVLGDILARLKPYRSSLLYYSDHGQILIKDSHGKSLYKHGLKSPNKEAYDVPQLIWYNKEKLTLPKVIPPTYSLPYSTANNYYLIQDWLGIELQDNVNIYSILSEHHQPQEKIEVSDVFSHVTDYASLSSENSQY